MWYMASGNFSLMCFLIAIYMFWIFVPRLCVLLLHVCFSAMDSLILFRNSSIFDRNFMKRGRKYTFELLFVASHFHWWHIRDVIMLVVWDIDRTLELLTNKPVRFPWMKIQLMNENSTKYFSNLRIESISRSLEPFTNILLAWWQCNQRWNWILLDQIRKLFEKNFKVFGSMI